MIPLFDIAGLLSQLAEPVLWVVSAKFRERTRAEWARGGARRRIARVLSWLLISALLIAVVLWILLAWLLPAPA
ncbi:MAG: hypothetical protein KDI81_07010 [Xanthomonadales bacterium]|nr:hypothetical protein [Xanthomonadales bacterium]